MKLCFALLAALLAVVLIPANAAPGQVCVFSIAATKLASLNGAALDSVHAALADIAKGAPHEPAPPVVAPLCRWPAACTGCT